MLRQEQWINLMAQDWLYSMAEIFHTVTAKNGINVL